MPLTIYKRGDIWHYRGTVAGERLRGSTKTSDRETAQRIASNIESQQWKCSLDGPGAILTFTQAVALYQAAGKPSRFLARIHAHWKGALVKDMTSGAIKQSAIVLYPAASGATRNRQVIVPTQAVINHAAEMELCSPIRVKRFPVVKTEREPATWEWVQAFMAEARQPHLRALACFLYLTGSRISDALNVQWGDVDFSAGFVSMQIGKRGGDAHVSHMPPELIVALANIPDRKPRVFKYTSRKSAEKEWEKVVERAGIRKLSFHSCRHGFATGLLHAGVDVVTVAKRGGWKTPQHVLGTYGHALEDRTVTNVLTDAPRAQRPAAKPKTIGGTSA